MINLVGHDGEEQTGHLAESEVAHLLSTLQNAEFTRSETRNLQKDKSFKPRSLIEIASAAQARETEIKLSGTDTNQTTDMTDLADELADTVEQNTLKNLSNNDPDVSTKENFSPDQPTLESAVFPLTVNKIVEEESNNNKVSETTLDFQVKTSGLPSTSDQSSEELAAAKDEQNGQISVGFETANEAFERGKAEGIIEGREAAIVEIKAAAELDARAELASKVSAFEEALAALTKPQAMQVEALTKSIHATILRLASERAGSQIDDMPEAFANRVDALTNSIGKKMNEGQVQLNLDDYALMKPFFADSAFDFVVNPDLKRGDAVLQFDGVELRDIAENRTGNNYSSEIEWEPVSEEITADQPKIVAKIDDSVDVIEAGLDVSEDVLGESES